MLIGLILLVLVVIGLMVAFAAFAIFCGVVIAFGGTALVITLMTGDKYLGFALAIPITGLVLWALSTASDKEQAKKKV